MVATLEAWLILSWSSILWHKQIFFLTIAVKKTHFPKSAAQQYALSMCVCVCVNIK